jgi:glc operon protein GlcG
MTHTRDARMLTLEAAKALAEAGAAEAKRRGWTVAIAVVNPEGGLILFHCLDDTQPASHDIAIAKARAAARFRRPTKALEDAVTGGRQVLLGVPGLLPLEGGVPVTDGGAVIGAVGVSGMTSSEDGVIAAAALRALES